MCVGEFSGKAFPWQPTPVDGGCKLATMEAQESPETWVSKKRLNGLNVGPFSFYRTSPSIVLLLLWKLSGIAFSPRLCVNAQEEKFRAFICIQFNGAVKKNANVKIFPQDWQCNQKVTEENRCKNRVLA